ncbi:MULTISPECIES: GTP cyclohydrolase I [Streptomyces]|uniref:GTP cyclohydrolase 1 n=1 Tax=Streptomyces caniscabiei TaxID=2746961 RepID=A0ABU4MJI0_9ACTN|nr:MULTISPECIES: GTP cyclohydrolase I [Streptomyces]MBE4735188.1 GTP cyclohydrolase I [Streptomyces caniscabiei]MBE4754322.1 GTP cyclohydrolase I [Streptomyces caniscabiei]MBE4767914.1 GTP cyclohydrolase I [Streptomyces caniscabiei]MBE4784370.1 GTP cyclohydrolase I [Streptomyces caniscabiei]MBE4791131.1 GTP cyclohydrolase I [Streptomyces caniscabiei]
MTTSIAQWLEENVTTDKRALDWYQEEECEPRIVRAYRELLSGYDIDTSKILKTTVEVDGEHAGVVRVHDINYFSICAHHFLPFFGKIAISYVPGDRILGLGKFPRLVQAYSKRFQIQEHLVKDIAEEIMSSGGARAARVVSNGRHMCMCSRGPSDQTVITDTSYVTGQKELFTRYGLDV